MKIKKRTGTALLPICSSPAQHAAQLDAVNLFGLFAAPDFRGAYMHRSRLSVTLIAVFFLIAFATAQEPVRPGVIPKLINYSGVLKDSSGKVLTSVTGVTFLIYAEEHGGAPLWMETQNVQPDARGNYTAQLGATKPDGIPLDLFSSGEARWLALLVNGGEEQPRVLLAAVPYALKAADAETVGGLPASAFVLAAPGMVGAASPTAGAAPGAATVSGRLTTSSNVTTSGGKVNTIPLFSTATDIENSILTQTGTKSVSVGGTLNLPAMGAATKTAGKNSRAETIVASSFNSSTSTAVNQTFQLQAEAAGNNTSTPSGTLNLLFGSGTTPPSETGLKISSKGIFTFASGQTFPGTGSGTITGVTAGNDLTGGGTKGSVTLNLDTTKVPLLAASNSFSGDNTFSVSTTDAIDAYTTGAGKSAVVALNNATSGGSEGVFAWTLDSAGSGVVGLNKSSNGGIGVWGEGVPGVYGFDTSSSNAAGVWGQNGTLSHTGAITQGQQAVGVWGDGGSVGLGSVGVLGTNDDGLAGFFENDSPNGYPALWVLGNSTQGVFVATGLANASCEVDISGNLNCTGSKNAVVPVDGGKRIVAMSAIESPVNWFEDFGSARLLNGAAVVAFDKDFIQTVNTEMEYHVFLTPKGDCKGLYVSNEGSSGFEVHELDGGNSSVAFDYRITAMRKNYESIRFADHTHDLDGVKRMQERMKAGAGHAMPHMRQPMVAPVAATSRTATK